MKISKRLELLSNEVKGFNEVVDVGCDHGLFSIYSILNCNIKHAYLLDINKEPLNSAKLNFKKYNLDNASFVQTDGLIDFDQKIDCLVISGLGGYLMVKILNDSLEKVSNANKLVLQPNSDFDVVRKFLLENNFTITFEKMIIDNKKYCYYLTAVKGSIDYNEDDILYGPILRNNIDEIYYNYWDRRYELLSKEVINVKDELQKELLLNKINNIKKFILKK